MSRTARGPRRWARVALVRLQRYEPLHRLVRRLGAVAVRRLGSRLAALPGVEAVFARHTHPGSPDFVLGQSDLDLGIVLTEEAAGDAECVGVLADAVDRLQATHFYLQPQDARFLTNGELRTVERLHGCRFEILGGPEDWTLVAGRDVRPGPSPAFPPWDVWRHPELHQIWRNNLQVEVIEPRHGLEGRNLRAPLRLAGRQRERCLAALPHLVEEDLVLPSLLDGITRSGYWVDDPGPRRERLLHAVLTYVHRFCEAFLAEPALRLEPGRLPSESERHENAWDALRTRLAEFPGLTDRLAGAVAYPLPFSRDGIYRLDMMLPDDVSDEDFSSFLREYRRTLRRKLFRLGENRFVSTVMLDGLARSALVQHVTPFPFFREHLQRYAVCLAGAEPEMLDGCASAADRVAWCRSFVPYYLFTLGRRIEHSSELLNFHQLASVRLFLETGEIETDADRVRRRHRDRFEHGPDERIWGFLQRDRPGRSDRGAYRDALGAFSHELERVESLLGVAIDQPASPSRPGSTPPIVAS